MPRIQRGRGAGTQRQGRADQEDTSDPDFQEEGEEVDTDDQSQDRQELDAPDGSALKSLLEEALALLSKRLSALENKLAPPARTKTRSIPGTRPRTPTNNPWHNCNIDSQCLSMVKSVVNC